MTGEFYLQILKNARRNTIPKWWWLWLWLYPTKKFQDGNFIWYVKFVRKVIYIVKYKEMKK